MIAIASCLAAYLFCLFLERALLEKRLARIPVRICVTGTRGKSAVTRLVAAALRESGFRVLAKTTGSKAAVLLPGGEEKDVERAGVPSVLEGKKIIRLASRLRAQVIIAELMSIQKECLFVESRRIFKPNVLVLTNVREDHLDLMGRDKPAIARSFSRAFPERAVVFMPEEERFPVFDEAALGLRSEIRVVAKSADGYKTLEGLGLRYSEFEENIRLALGVSAYLGVDRDAALAGLRKAVPDFGSLKAWIFRRAAPAGTWYFISAFAANEPESTGKIMALLRENHDLRGMPWIGLLNLRRDRGDRTEQWADALEKGGFGEFTKIFLTGGHARAMMRRLRSSTRGPAFRYSLLSEKSAERIHEKLLEVSDAGAVVVGMGNIAGAGRRLVEFWERTGEIHGC